MSRGSDFWSRRKAKVEAEAVEDARRTEETEARAAQAELEEKSDDEVLEELGLPDPDELEPGQDISGFMQKSVPERLRQRALRQLWRLNPTLANLDGLCDYNDDFTNAATDAPGVATAYKVGKGLLKHIEAMEKESLEQATEPQSDNPENPSELADVGTFSETIEENAGKTEILQNSADTAGASTTIVGSVAEYADETAFDTVNAEPVHPRRMRFRIESETE